jgi:hypothetical protein
MVPNRAYNVQQPHLQDCLCKSWPTHWHYATCWLSAICKQHKVLLPLLLLPLLLLLLLTWRW